MPSSDLRDAVLLLAPGFIALWVYTTFGRRRPRTDWQWAVWSVIASIPLDYVTRWLVGNGPRLVAMPPELADGLTRLALAVLAGFLLALGWNRLRRWPWRWARYLADVLTDSLWDMTLEDAEYLDRSLEVETVDGWRYYGWYKVAREDSGAEPWVRMELFTRTDPDGVQDIEIGRIGVLIHRSQIRRVTVYEGPKETAERHAREAAAPKD